jgi:hypothetical protein
MKNLKSRINQGAPTMRTLLCYLPVLLLVTLLSACGDTAHPSTTGGSLKAVIKPAALTAGLNIAGIQLTLTVPVGVSPPLLPDGKADPAATVVITSAAAQNQNLPGGTYTPATATSPGQLEISAIVASGFSATDEITIHLNVAPGAFPVASDFNLLSFKAFDINGKDVTGLNPTLTTTIQ